MKTAANLIEPSRNLLPSLAEVEAALDANMRERRRLMTLKRLVLDADGEPSEEVDDGPSGQGTR